MHGTRKGGRRRKEGRIRRGRVSKEGLIRKVIRKEQYLMKDQEG